MFGALALEGAALAVADARAVGARGEDWSGFLLAPTGIVLVGLAVVRSGALGGPAGSAICAAPGSCSPPFSVRTGSSCRWRARSSPRTGRVRPWQPADLGRPYQEVTVETSDGLDLAGWYVPSLNGAAVISYPTRTGKLPQARMLVRHGYGVLLLDARGYDGSEGDPNMFGWAGEQDIDAAVAWLGRRPDVKDGRIGGIGFSVGGEVMLQAAAANPRLRAVVSEGAGSRSVREDLMRGPRGWLAIPTAALQSTAVAVLSGTEPPPSLEELMPRIAPRPVFLISAGHGGGGEELNADYYRAAAAPKEKWVIKESRHVGGFQARPQEYERRVTRFFERALSAPSESSQP